MNSRYIEKAIDCLKEVDELEWGNVKKAGTLIGDSIMQGGIIIAFGSGHSEVGARELVNRAGGLFSAKKIKDPSEGMFERLEGSGYLLTDKVEIRPEDVVVIISNSGRNPAGIEVAMRAKEKGAKVVAVTAVESSKKVASRHSSGKKLYELADVVLDLHTVEGDAAIEVDGLKEKICGTSTVVTVGLLQSVVMYSVEYMISKGFNPPVRVSANLDGGFNRSLEIEKKYANRIYRF